MTLTKVQIVDELFAQGGFTKTESAQIIDTLFELMKQSQPGLERSWWMGGSG